MFFTSFMRIAQLLSVFAMLATGAFAQVSIVPLNGSNVLDGDPPHLLITGLRPGEIVSVHSFRNSTDYEPPTYTAVPLLAHAEAVFSADSVSKIAVDSAAPIHGTYSGIHPLGLLWSRNRLALDGSPKLPFAQAVRLQSSTDVVCC